MYLRKKLKISEHVKNQAICMKAIKGMKSTIVHPTYEVINSESQNKHDNGYL